MAKNPLTGVTNAEIMNAVRAEAPASYQERVPIATRANFAETGTAILDFKPTYNEFVAGLVDKFAFQYVHEQIIRNPLAEFKRPAQRRGRYVEEIFVDAAKASPYSPELAETEVWKRVIPDIGAIYHTINRQDKYKQTIERVELERAVIEEYGLSSIVGQIIQALYNGDNYDEFLIMKELLGYYYTNKLFYPVTTGAITDQDSAREFVKLLQQYSGNFTLPSRAYNSMGVLRQLSYDDMVFFITPKTEADVGVDVLAYTFNMAQADYKARRILVDDFGTGTDNVIAILADRELIQQWDTYYSADSIYNPEGIYTNALLHHHGIYSTSRFANAVAFVTTNSDVATVTVNGSATANRGTTTVYTATVAGTSSNYAPAGVRWSLTGNTSTGTYITMAGRLAVSSEEKAETLTITATSVYDTTKTGTKQVTLS